MGNVSLQLLFLIVLSTFLYFDTIKLAFCHDGLNVSCIDIEKKALLEFKSSLLDPSGRLSSWRRSEDCCRWRGVSCSTKTKHVIKLDLRNPVFDYSDTALGGKISSSLLDLKYLSYLDLSFNNFSATQIPKFFGSLENLRYLNLSHASFYGSIPQSLGNLSNLQYLDLSDFNSDNPVQNDIRCVSGLSSLKHLDLSFLNLNGTASYWLQTFNTLPSLLELHLSWCQLLNLPPFLSSINFTSLSVLDLSSTGLDSTIPQWLFNLSSLKQLDLSHNSLRGEIPDAFSKLNSLKQLDLSHNSLRGVIPDAFSKLSALKTLDLSDNAIEGKLPRSLGKLCNLKVMMAQEMNITGDIRDFIQSLSECSYNSLETLDLTHNHLNGNLPNSLGFLKNLQSLRLGYNSFTGSIPETIGNLSSLKELELSDNQMNGNIAKNLGQLSSLVSLSLSENPWEGIITEAHLVNLSSLKELSVGIRFSPNISLVFNISSDWIPPFKLRHIKIQSCRLGPEFPKWLKNQTELAFVTLNNARISDTIPDWFMKLHLQLGILNLAHNQLRGKVPNSLRFTYGANVDLSSNLFEGPIPLWSSDMSELHLNDNMFCGPIPPDIGIRMPTMRILNISSNFLDGSLPMSLGNMRDLIILAISNNRLSGELPSGLRNCIKMATLDLGDNQLSGSLPAWVGETMPSLKILRLRNNSFIGNIPLQLCSLSSLHMLDLSKNNLSGTIPPCIGSLTGFKTTEHSYRTYQGSLQVDTKGSILQYESTLDLFNSIDLSENDLSGEIPTNITSLFALDTLNLSKNHLTGNIPSDIGSLTYLESLDLSLNQLSGPIPTNMTSLTLLNHLNLSHNNLSGYIPTSNQFQTFNDPSIYMGNTALCGSPLQSKCGNETSITGRDGDMNDGNEDSEDDDELEKLKFFAVVGLGFFLGFWGVCGTLIIKKHLRDAYFLFLLRMKDKICGVLTSK